MLNSNEYFDGKVKSIALQVEGTNATIGAMAPGEYEFGTIRKEVMKVVSGGIEALLPGESEWSQFTPGDTFTIEANEQFQVKIAEDTSYLCLYY